MRHVRNVARVTERNELSLESFALRAPLQIDVYESRDDERILLGFEPEVDLTEVWWATLGVGARL
jgi:hypothetical protein